jgi:succinylarginine dihydrolase
LVAELGIPQGVFPPHERPCLEFLRTSGFAGSDESVIAAAARQRPDLLSIASSASAMWAANAATVSPSCDTSDGRVHLTPANLVSTAHRRLEPKFTTRMLRSAFADETHFCVHDPLPSDSLPSDSLPGDPTYSDEGAANHMRLCRQHEESGVEFFVYGHSAAVSRDPDSLYPARQSKEASLAVIRQHGLSSDSVVLARQSRIAIDTGVFHNDVIAVANERVLLCHEGALEDQAQVLAELRAKFPSLHVVQVSADELSIQDVVETYLFNSQLLSRPDGSMLLLCPTDCQTHSKAYAAVQKIVAETPQISAASFIDVRQSMQNGGGPACLRLRVVLTADQLAAVHRGFILTKERFVQLETWIQRHYREELTVEALADPKLLTESRTALDQLTGILDLESIYSFQH